jgi:tyrosyl-tRNA synthetase
MAMTLSEELRWRGFVNQTTFKDISAVDDTSLTFYWGVDPSASSMTIGNLAAAMMVKQFMKHGHKAVLLVGGATGLIGDPDGKAEERTLKNLEEIAANKQAIAAQYSTLFSGMEFDIVDNYDWFKDIGYLQFLRDIGKHVPMRQMLQREFIQSRLGEEGAGISYAEFSYVLIQGYDFLQLYRDKGVTLQVCGSDQWGNSIAGVELIRRIEGAEAHVWSTPLIINKATGKKFGKSESGAVWLDPALTSPTQFYQFWINADDEGVEDYMKVYTELEKGEIDRIMEAHKADPGARIAQHELAREVTQLVHGTEAMERAALVTQYLIGSEPIEKADDTIIQDIKAEIPSAVTEKGGSILSVLVEGGLAESISDARRLLKGKAVSVNGKKVEREQFEADDFKAGRALVKKGKKFKDSILVEADNA